LLPALTTAADSYADALKAPAEAGAQVDPEAQVTSPFAAFITTFCEAMGIGQARLFREAQLDGVKPDFDVRVDDHQRGWIELKKPGHSLDGHAWTGRERTQWELLAELDPLIVSDGHKARLYRVGELVGDEVLLPAFGADDWDPRPLEELLRLFVSVSPTPIRRVSHLARRLAPLARMLRDRIAAGLTPETPVVPIKQAKTVWTANVHVGASDEQFANDLAQVIAYSLAIASMQPGVDANRDHTISLAEARDALRSHHGVLAAALGPALEVPGLQDALVSQIGAIERLVSGVDQAAIASSSDPRGEPWLWFYEDFLQIYDPVARKKAGVYYTPTEIVQMQVRHVDHILRSEFGRKLGFGDKQVVTLDPATGSGTYPLAILDIATDVAIAQRGLAGPAQVAKNLTDNLLAFEILPGPYAVAHLRVGQRLASMEGTLTARKSPRVYLTDTLDDPDKNIPTLNLWGDPEVLADERRHADQVKREQPVTVVIGNPPYFRRNSKSGGGWVVHPAQGRALYDDVTDAAKEAGVIFSAMRSVYDDYLYFWRWALWKAFEQDPDRPAIVSFITSSSWLSGPAFVGLRRIARQHADEMWIVDLGGQGRGAVTEQNVFAIKTPVAVVTMYRKGKTKPLPATVRYRRIRGSRVEKLVSLSAVEAPAATSVEWLTVDTLSDADKLIPGTGDDAWAAMPALTDLFPWQGPGVNRARSWPTEVASDVLAKRWKALLASPLASERARRFVTPTTGRTIHTRVGGRPTIAELLPDALCPEIIRYGWRSFDRQWLLLDPRLVALERPALWQSRSDRQIYLTSMITGQIGKGPAMSVAVDVPDFHHFCNRGGKDVIPLYRDAAGQHPNVSAGLLDVLSTRYGRVVTPEDLAAYTYAILAHPGYQQRFVVELETPGPRVPLTANDELFRKAVGQGERLLWLHTWAERFRGPSRGVDLPPVKGQSWTRSVSAIPATPDQITYDPVAQTLHIGDGRVTGVRKDVWEFSVSGFPVVQRWLSSRTVKGAGRSADSNFATPLDEIRPTVWEDGWNDELLDLLRMVTHTVDGYPAQTALMEQILDGELIDADDLPGPSAAERIVPATLP
jgi:hypothetical protein